MTTAILQFDKTFRERAKKGYPLAEMLMELGIKPYDQKSIRRYMTDVVRRENPGPFWWFGLASRSVWLGLVTFTGWAWCAVLLMGMIGTVLVVSGNFILQGKAMLVGAMLIFCIAMMAFELLKEVESKQVWFRSELLYWHRKTMPRRVLRQVSAIEDRKELPVTFVVYSTEEDPILFVCHKRERYPIAVWDEPKFRG